MSPELSWKHSAGITALTFEPSTGPISQVAIAVVVLPRVLICVGWLRSSIAPMAPSFR